MRSRLRPGVVLRNTIVILLAAVWALPTYLVVVNATTPVTKYTGKPVWWPKSFGLLQNIATGWTKGHFAVPVFNSVLYAVSAAAASVLIGALGAFAVVQLPVRRRKLWFWLIYSGTLLPLQVFVVPLFLASAKFHLYDTRMVLILVYIALCIPFTFFVSRNFLTTVPVEIAQAAKLDGAGNWRLFRSVFFPIMRPALAAGFVFQFIYVWNELFFGISLVIARNNQPVMAVLSGLQGQGSTVGPPAVLATAIVISLPAVLIFLFFQRFFVSGLTAKL
jgi:multiple sugar transport system permease protein